MALYSNHAAHQAGLDQRSAAELNRLHQQHQAAHHMHHVNHDDRAHRDDKAILDMETVSDVSSSDRVNVFVVFIFILELLVLVFVCVLEFFLRFTSVFNVRLVKFSCSDQSLSYNTSHGPDSYREFAYNAVVPYELVISLCFCLPPFIMVIGEIALWAFTESRQKTVRVLCRGCPLPQVIRRIIRYIGTFLFGLVVTMIFTDVIKVMVGRLRPTFLQVCRPDWSRCGLPAELVGQEICTGNDDRLDLRDARLSFPSMHAAMTAFTAVYMSIYVHHTIRAHSVRVIRPFAALGFVMLAVLCCVTRYGLYYSHWEDVVLGFLLGTVMAVYIGVFSLNNFREHMRSEALYNKLRYFMAEQRAVELRDLYKEDRLDRVSYFGIPAYNPATLVDTYQYNGAMAIPRPQMRMGHLGLGDNESTTDPSGDHDFRGANKDKYRRHDTFQRDLHHTLDQFQHHSLPPQSGLHRHQRSSGSSYGHM